MSGFGEHPAGTAAAYHADQVADVPTLSASIAKVLCSASPAHARAAHPKLNPDFEPTDEAKFDVGTVSHALLLEGLQVADVLHYDSWRTKDAKEARDLSRSHGRVPLLASQWDSVRRMVDAAQTQLAASDVTPQPFTAGKPEQTLVWETGGVACRALVDWLHNDHKTIDDYKSTAASAHPSAWAKTALDTGADVQLAMYTIAVEELYGITPEFRFIVQEVKPPYALSVIVPENDWIALGRDKVAYALGKWRDCLASGDWHGYPSRAAYIELPGWAETRWLERRAQEEMPV